MQDCILIHTQASVEEKELQAANVSDSKKLTLYDILEELIMKLDAKYAEMLQISQPDSGAETIAAFNENRSVFLKLIKHFR